VVWGDIAGTLANQTDLQSAIDAAGQDLSGIDDHNLPFVSSGAFSQSDIYTVGSVSAGANDVLGLYFNSDSLSATTFPAFSMYTSRGTKGAPSAPASSDVLGSIRVSAYSSALSAYADAFSLLVESTNTWESGSAAEDVTAGVWMRVNGSLEKLGYFSTSGGFIGGDYVGTASQGAQSGSWVSSGIACSVYGSGANYYTIGNNGSDFVLAQLGYLNDPFFKFYKSSGSTVIGDATGTNFDNGRVNFVGSSTTQPIVAISSATTDAKDALSIYKRYGDDRVFNIDNAGVVELGLEQSFIGALSVGMASACVFTASHPVDTAASYTSECVIKIPDYNNTTGRSALRLVSDGSSSTAYVSDDAVLITPEGGIAVKSKNKTGAASVKGTLLTASSTTDGGVDATGGSAYECVGVMYSDGVADGSDCYVVVSGIAEVLLKDSTSATRADWVGISDTAGRAEATAIPSPPTDAGHFREIGHANESKASGTDVLCKIFLHFN